MRPVLATLTACLLYPAAAARAAAPAHFADAPIHALYFVDRNEGWAVGDEGVIWHTFDGGKTWERQPSGTRASLRAVHFLTPYTGYAVGRIDVPSGGSVGVVLATTDGGLKWAQLGLNALPGLNCVRFFDERTGVVAGDGSDAFPTGVFRTTDGGRTWTPMRGPRCPTWLAADFSDPDNGVLAGAWSRLATLRNGMFGAADVDTLGGRSVCGMKLQGKRAVAVGHGGLVMLSPNTAGVRWGFANLGLPPEVLACCDFNAVSTVGDNIWVVGRPGTVVLHSPDAGKTWEVQRTGQALPLRAVHFASDTEGWAAGELGTILVTRDGGKSWQVQRQGGQRAAALFVHSANDRLPIDTVALLGCEEGYLTAALRVAAPDPASAPPARATEPMRLRAAMRRTGGAAGEALWQFPVADHLRGTDPQALVAAWDRLHGNRAPEELLRQLVLALRVWRPEVVVTDAVYARADDPASGVVPEAVQEAFKRAADENAFPEQLSVLGLEPWAAKKLYAAAPRSVGAHVHIDLTALRPHCGDGLRDFAAPAFALLGREGMPPRERHFRLLAARLKDAESQGHLMDGTALASGGTARRPLEPLTEADARALEQLEKAHRTRRTLQALCESGEGAAKFATPDQVVAHLGPALEQLPPGPGARAAHALAGHFARTGQWVLARELYLMMVDHYPADPLSADAYRWLAQFNASSEARRRHELGQFLVTTEAEVLPASARLPNAQIEGAPGLVRRANLHLLRNSVAARKWYQASLEMEPRLAAYGPLFAHDPRVQLCLQSARRQLGDAEAASEWYARFMKETAPAGGDGAATRDDPWRDCVAAELWLHNRAAMPRPPKPLTFCRPAALRPFLDGKLDDACWESARSVTLADAAGDPGEHGHAAKARFAHDADFLYVAVECTHPAAEPVPELKQRSHDMDLSGFDRVSVLIDLDRDYQTYYRLEFDRRGAVAEDCWGDRTWDPRWFVAVKAGEAGWTAEVAIPMRELTGEGASLGKVWACNVVRTIPGRGVQAWSLPAGAEPRPEGMGLLQFVDGGK